MILTVFKQITSALGLHHVFVAVVFGFSYTGYCFSLTLWPSEPRSNVPKSRSANRDDNAARLSVPTSLVVEFQVSFGKIGPREGVVLVLQISDYDNRELEAPSRRMNEWQHETPGRRHSLRCLIHAQTAWSGASGRKTRQNPADKISADMRELLSSASHAMSTCMMFLLGFMIRANGGLEQALQFLFKRNDVQRLQNGFDSLGQFS